MVVNAGVEHARSKRGSAKVYVDSGPSSGAPPSPPPSAAESSPSTGAATSDGTAARDFRKRMKTLRLSHDISTEQLFSDQLIDGKVADDDGDDDEEDQSGDKKNVEESASPVSESHQQSSPPRSPHRRQRPGTHRKSEPVAAATMPADGPNRHSQPSSVDKSGKMYRIESHSHLSSLEAKNLEQSDAVVSSASDVPTKKPSKRIALEPLTVTTQASDSICIKCATNKEMPPMHCAAYCGHLTCLRLLLDHDDVRPALMVDPTARPPYLDKKQRTPLFYSCAANRLECCGLLLTRRKNWLDLPDKQLDTPVHVCCFFGWHECLRELLDAGANPHGRNAKGFKPSHIAKTKECLELLLSYGDDLLQGDKLGRTPLFVACARDRSICVEFLCGWNHQTRSWMLEQEDQRGDRPIHAAACNGSDASLEILLRYGADPLVPNAKGMTPKDLAQSNNHQRCVELLTKAEIELTTTSTWFAPANAVAEAQGASTAAVSRSLSAAAIGDQTGGWIECWDNSSGQPFYYNNTSGKCQWEVPEGFQPQLLLLVQQRQQQQQQQESVEDDGEYIWVKKKKQTLCVVTGKESEWTVVQDPASRAIYYKNTRTGQTQWEEPDAVQQLQSASAAQASQQASQLWEELESARTGLAKALAADRQRQLQAQKNALEAFKLSIRERRDDIRKREEQAKLQQLLPRSSFIRRKKQSMVMKMKGSTSNSGPSDDDRMEQICLREPSLDIFLSTYLRLQGIQDLQLTVEKRFFNCLFHYYVALVDPVNMEGMSKSQFRTVLRDAAIIPSSFASSGGTSASTTAPPLKLHVVDLIFAQAVRVQAVDSTNSPLVPTASWIGKPGQPGHRLGASAVAASPGGNVDRHLNVVGFIAAMQIVRERVVTMTEENGREQRNGGPVEIDDDEEWFLSTYLLPLTVRHGTKMLSQIRECKELQLALTAHPDVQALVGANRQGIQLVHRHYTRLEPKLKMMTFVGLSQFAQDFGVTQHMPLPALHQLYEAVNWICGSAHTEIISFEKFTELLLLLALQLQRRRQTAATIPSIPLVAAGASSSSQENNQDDELMSAVSAFFKELEATPGVAKVLSSASVVDGTGAGLPNEASAAKSSLFTVSASTASTAGAKD
ncbi:hypothetical protein PINS_up003384 [Pythium insidiosum]|nr:hypothetical protein PINS_up003384 [Pythium insidiosum]